MDLVQLLDLLETSTLHLTQLSKFSDPFEGRPPRQAVLPDKEALKAMPLERRIEMARVTRINKHVFQKTSNLSHASCWHASEIESAAMWSLYLKAGYGIAIQTTAERLWRSLEHTENIYGGMMNYVDYDEHIAGMNIVEWAMLKRTSFSHEKEFRLLAFTGQDLPGIRLNIDATMLIENIYLSPAMPQWIDYVVTEVLKRYGRFSLVNSNLDRSPSYLSDEDLAEYFGDAWRATENATIKPPAQTQ